jgi:hypothetical protein
VAFPVLPFRARELSIHDGQICPRPKLFKQRYWIIDFSQTHKELQKTLSVET